MPGAKDQNNEDKIEKQSGRNHTDFKTYNKATGIKAAQHWLKELTQSNGIEQRTQTDSHRIK